MTSKEALLKANWAFHTTYRDREREFQRAMKVIKKDLDKLESVWDYMELTLQNELTKHVNNCSYETLNEIKMNTLKQLKEWLENDK